MLIIQDTRAISEEKFRAERRKAVQATDTPKLLNLNKYAGALSVFQEKMGIDSDQDFSFFTRDGQMLEPVLIERFKSETGLDAFHAPELHRLNKAPLGCTIDGYCHEAGRTGLLEIKAVGQYSWDDWTPDAPPPMYHLQVQHQLMVTGAPFAYIFGWSWGNGTRCYKILPNDQIQDQIYAVAKKFWTDYVLQNLPPLDGDHFATVEDLKALYPRGVPKLEKELSDESILRINEYTAIRDQIKGLESVQDVCKVELMKELGEAERGIAPNGQIVNWSTVETATLDVKAIKEKEPEIYAKYLRTRTSRRFSIGKEA